DAGIVRASRKTPASLFIHAMSQPLTVDCAPNAAQARQKLPLNWSAAAAPDVQSTHRNDQEMPDGTARLLLLERADDARCRQGEAVLSAVPWLVVRSDGVAHWRILVRQNGR